MWGLAGRLATGIELSLCRYRGVVGVGGGGDGGGCEYYRGALDGCAGGAGGAGGGGGGRVEKVGVEG